MSIEQFLLDSQAAAAAIAASRLLHCGLAKEQKATFAFLVTNAVSCFVLSLFVLSSHHYFWWYIACVTVTDFVAAAAVRELFFIAVAAYPGIKTAGKWMMYGTVLASALISLGVTPLLSHRGTTNGWTNLYYVLNLHRSLQFSLAAMILSLLVFLSHYPLELRRNIYVSSYFFSAVFLIDAASTLLATLSPTFYSRYSDMAQVAVVSFCFVAWALMLRREGVQPQKVVFRTSQDVELIRQLESLNQTLSRIGRR